MNMRFTQRPQMGIAETAEEIGNPSCNKFTRVLGPGKPAKVLTSLSPALRIGELKPKPHRKIKGCICLKQV